MFVKLNEEQMLPRKKEIETKRVCKMSNYVNTCIYGHNVERPLDQRQERSLAVEGLVDWRVPQGVLLQTWKANAFASRLHSVWT